MKALSIRQPWAWLILHAGKDIENRQWSTRFRGRVLIHAGKTMTRDEYADALQWAAEVYRGPRLLVPPPKVIERGGIVGAVDIVDCVGSSDSPWFVGEFGFVLRNPEVLPFRPYKGALGFFDVKAEPPHCPKCGYTAEDCRIHGDHHLCGEPTPSGPSDDGVREGTNRTTSGAIGQP